MEDFYDILKIPENADRETIRIAFRRLAKQYHPDSPSGDAGKFRQIHRAYKILWDPASRLDYDKTLKNFREKTGGMEDYTRHLHRVQGKHLKSLVKELYNQGHMTRIFVRHRGKKLFALSFPVAAGIAAVGIIKAPIALLLINFGIAALFEVEVINQVIELYNQALSKHESGRLTEAEQLYEKILQKSEYFIPAHMNLGLLHRQRGDNQKAIQCFKKALEMAPFGELGEAAKRHLQDIRGF